MTDGNGHASTSGYDTANRQTTVSDALGNTTFTYYDANGNVTQVKDPRGNSTNYSFDALDRQTVVTNALGQRTTTGYDAAGNVISVENADDDFTTYSYDAPTARLPSRMPTATPPPPSTTPRATSPRSSIRRGNPDSTRITKHFLSVGNFSFRDRFGIQIEDVLQPCPPLRLPQRPEARADRPFSAQRLSRRRLNQCALPGSVEPRPTRSKQAGLTSSVAEPADAVAGPAG
jgi:YD repeat-containing protein